MSEESELLVIENILTIEEIAKLREIIETKYNLLNYKLEITPGSKIGDNFIGLIYKVKVSGTNSTVLNFVIKCSMRNESFRKLAPIEKFYKRENYMYTTVLPIYEELQKVHNLKTLFKNYPKIYFSSEKLNNEYFIMNDLNTEFFHHLNRKMPLNLQHCELFMKTIGTFHALSFAFKEYCKTNSNWNFNKIVSQIQEDIFTQTINPDELKEQILIQNDMVVKTCFDPDLDRSLIDKVNCFSQQFFDTLYLLTDPKNNDEYSVIIHGDCWTNNLMFKYENSSENTDKLDKINPIDLFFIDFQESRYTSPVWDLMTFMCTSMDYPTIHNNFDNLIKIYYENINELLMKMNYDIVDIFPYQILQKHLQKYFKIGVGLAAYMLLPIMLRNDESCVQEFEEAIIAEDGNVLKALNLNSSMKEQSNNLQFKDRIIGVFKFAIERDFL